MEFLTVFISRLSIIGILVGLKLPGPVVKPHPLKSQVIKLLPPGGKCAPLSTSFTCASPHTQFLQSFTTFS